MDAVKKEENFMLLLKTFTNNSVTTSKDEESVFSFLKAVLVC